MDDRIGERKRRMLGGFAGSCLVVMVAGRR